MEYKRLNILDKRAKNNGANPYVDDYVGFTWNNIHSSAYNCFIENTGHLEFIGAPDFSNNFISPAFQTRTYYTGMQNSSKKFSLNLVFYQLSLSELNAAFRWLDRAIVSDFYFDYEPYWKYSCKLSSIGAVEKYVTGRAMYRGHVVDLYLCRVPVTFETVYHPEAISAYTVYKYSDDGIDHKEDLYYEYSSTTGAQYFPYTTEKTPNDQDSNLPGPFQLLGGDIFGVKYEEEISKIINQGQIESNTKSVVTAFYTKNPSVFKPLTTIIDQIEGSRSADGYWRLTLKNPSAYPTPFKIHCYNVFDGIEIYRVDNSDWMWKNKDDEEDIDANINAELICTVNLKLDDDVVLDLNYNSEDGTVLCANQLIEQIRGAASNIPCTYKNAVANIYVPGTQDPDNPAELILEVWIHGKSGTQPQLSVEYNTYEYMI